MAEDDTAQQATQSAPSAPPAVAPTVIGMSEAEAQAFAAQQHLAGWLAQEVARLEHELAYVRGAAAQARDGLHVYLARTFGVDAAHEPGIQIDLAARTITRPATPPATPPATTTTSTTEQP